MMTLIPWEAGRPVIWDVTVACRLPIHMLKHRQSREAGAAAEIAATRKMAKYTDMPSQFVSPYCS